MSFAGLHISTTNTANAAAVRERIDHLTKPLGSLGRIEELAIRLAGIGELPQHGYAKRGILVAAGDHGVTAENVSAYPSDVTPQMVELFLSGRAAINAFARSAAAQVLVADFGVAAELAPHPNLLSLRIAAGTENFARGDAMTQSQMTQALDAGVRAAELLLERDAYQIVALGEMGIGNTTSAAALTASITETPTELVVGSGTGIDAKRLAHKRKVVAEAVKRVASRPMRERIAALGGFEIVGLAGAMAAFASRRIPVLIDGYIVASAALILQALAPQAVHVLIPTHRSQEPGHIVALGALALAPYFDLEMRLGEATGAALAFGLCDAAARMTGEMMTFAEAGVATEIDANKVSA
jgi:nicotinate-nucleotide--dimethylbenzimidazole phosphoribosyltransferase